MDRSRLQKFLSQPVAAFPLAEAPFVAPETSVRAAMGLMREGSRSCVLALAEGRLAGIFTERDVLTRCMDAGFDWDRPLADGLLTRDPQTIGAKRTIAEAIATMQKHRYRTLPVVDGAQVMGVVRLGDIITHLAEAYPEEVLNLPPRPHQVMGRQEGG